MNRPTLPMPPGLPRLFVGDGKTMFKGPAMSLHGGCWYQSCGSVDGTFGEGTKYALPPLRKRVSARDVKQMARIRYGNCANCKELEEACVYGWNAAMREAKKGGGICS